MTTAARHLAPTSTPDLTPAYYLTPDTRTYPFALLLEGCGIDADDPMPVAHGVRMLVDRNPGLCPECRLLPVAFAVETTESGGGNPAYDLHLCVSCTVGGENAGLLPSYRVDFIPYE